MIQRTVSFLILVAWAVPAEAQLTRRWQPACPTCGPNGCPAPAASTAKPKAKKPVPKKKSTSNEEPVTCPPGCPCEKLGPCCDKCLCAPRPLPAGNDEKPGFPLATHNALRDGEPNFGIDVNRLSKDGNDHYRHDGKEITKEEAIQLIRGGAIPNEAGLLHLTIIGTEAQRKQVRADLEQAPELTTLKSRLVVQDYGPDSWAIGRAGFVAAGQPTIYVQAQDGKVLHRQDDYSDGAAGLAEAIRLADANYKPAADQDLRNHATPGPRTPDLPSLPPVVWLLGGLGVVGLLSRPKTASNVK